EWLRSLRTSPPAFPQSDGPGQQPRGERPFTASALPPAHAPDLLAQPQLMTGLGIPALGKFALDAQGIGLRRRVLVEDDHGVVGPGLVRHGPNRKPGSGGLLAELALELADQGVALSQGTLLVARSADLGTVLLGGATLQH